MAARKQELEEILHDMEARIEEEEEKTLKMSEERKKFQLHVQDLEEQLEEEEAARQKMQIEKVQAEGIIKKSEEALAVYEDANQKGLKEKKLIEERLADVNSTLAEEEEKSKHLSKLKAKHESTIGELEDKLRKDNQQRQEVERSKRKIETELNDLKEQVGEKKTQVRRFLIIFSQQPNFRFDLGCLKFGVGLFPSWNEEFWRQINLFEVHIKSKFENRFYFWPIFLLLYDQNIIVLIQLRNHNTVNLLWSQHELCAFSNFYIAF